MLPSFEQRSCRAAAVRIGCASVLALAFSLAVYLMLQAVRPQDGVVSFSFLLILPAAVTAFVCYVSDPWKERSRSWYLYIAVWLAAAVVVGSVFVLREGAICVVMLTPLWLASGVGGALLTHKLRRRGPDARVFSSGALLLPILVMVVEPAVPLPASEIAVRRDVVIDAPVDRLWPLLHAIPDVRSDEGKWNVTHDVLGVPRPQGASLVRTGVGADRLAAWGPACPLSRAHHGVGAWTPDWLALRFR